MIYFIKDGAYVKIGYSQASAHVRLKELQMGNPRPLTLLGVMRGTQAQEHGLHHRFRAYHVRGEWFKRGLELTAYIDSNAYLSDEFERQVLEYETPPQDSDVTANGMWLQGNRIRGV